MSLRLTEGWRIWLEDWGQPVETRKPEGGQAAAHELQLWSGWGQSHEATSSGEEAVPQKQTRCY